MTGTSDRKRKGGKDSTPPAGYVCSICKKPGHWIQQCPQKKKQKKRNANPAHVHVPGVDPSQDDIARARDLQKIKPPKCFCQQISRLKKVKKSIAGGEESRAVGNYFFFCNKAKGDESKCRFARPVEDVIKPTKDRVCTFFAKTGSCKKGDKCMFSHDVPGGKGKAKDESPSEPEDQTKPVATVESGIIEKEMIGSGSSSSSSSSDSDDSSALESEDEETEAVVTKESGVVEEKETLKKNDSNATSKKSSSSSDSASSSDSNSDGSDSDSD